MQQPITRVFTTMVLILAVAASWPLLAAPGQAGEERGEETYTMVAVPTKGSISGRVTIDITMRIKEYSTDEEILELLEVLKEGGTDRLRRTMEKIQKGKISPQGRIAADIAVARVRKTEEGERIIVVTARTIPGVERYV
ncbi:MAG: hypothetical protein IH794_09215, partial [Acidobacteria bacterium]|nr:hypothetical protein [Acidobacteriota bacterium]